ncbi:MAG: hypothetical protein RDU25_02070 [Patescibacteria group bacterium]|nr:hypothetical protein [Patescibacteria group bacterium]
MGARQKFSSFAEMPTGLRTFLFSENFNQAEQTLQAKYKFPDDAKVFIGDKVMDAIFGDSELPQAVDEIKAKLVPISIPEDKWQEFMIELLKLETWPLRELFGRELTSILDQKRITTAGWPSTKVYLKPMTYSGAATEIAARSGFTLMGPQMRERLRDLITSKVKGVRIDSQVKDVLTRPEDFGGLGLDAEMASKTIEVMNEIVGSVKIMSEEDYSDWLAEEARIKAEAEERAKAPLPGEEDAEITAIKRGMAEEAKRPLTALESAVAKTYDALPNKPADEYLTNRLKHIISSRLRDVRNALEVVQLFERDTKVGGLGMDHASAESLGTIIEKSYTDLHQSILDEEKGKIEEQLASQRTKIEERKVREAEEHAKWYQDKILSRKQDEDTKKKLAQQMKQSFLAGATTEIPMHPMDLKEKRLEKERFGELVSAVSAGAAPIEAVKPKPEAPAPAKPAPATAQGAARPAPPTARFEPVQPQMPFSQASRPEITVSKQTIMKQPATAGLKPKMEDVKYSGPRLSGLVQELAAISLDEFRRLGKDPEAAAKKIMQKIETLGGESFEKRLEGIQAWNKSPLLGSYMSLVSEAFRSGKSVADAAADKRAAGQDAMTPEEVAAVINLNSKLHFE